MENVDIWFVNLGIQITNHSKGITIGGFTIAFYGMIIGLGVLAGLTMSSMVARRTNQNPDTYIDLGIYGVIFGVIGARIYYVIFDWDNYKDNLLQIFNTRAGGLAIYGGVLAAMLTIFIFSRRRKIPFGLLLDTVAPGLLTGQIIGRWGNFFNCEAFGGYCDNIFAMRLNVALVNDYMISQELWDKAIVENGITYIQVHPTFLYEGMWNLMVLVIALFMTGRKKWNGEIWCIYLAGYGIGRFWIEALRTDQLKFFGSNLAVSQMVAIILTIIGLGLIVFNRKRVSKTEKTEG